MLAIVMVRQGTRRALRASCVGRRVSNEGLGDTPQGGTRAPGLRRKHQLLTGLGPPHGQAIDLEQPLLAHTEPARDLGEGITRLDDVKLRAPRTLVAHAELVAGMDGGVGVDPVQAYEGVEVEAVLSR